MFSSCRRHFLNNIYGVGEDTALIREINGRKRPERIRYMPILIVIRGEKLASADPCDGMGGCCPTIHVPAFPAGKCEASKFAEVQVGRSPKYETRRYRAKQAEQQMGSRRGQGLALDWTLATQRDRISGCLKKWLATIPGCPLWP